MRRILLPRPQPEYKRHRVVSRIHKGDAISSQLSIISLLLFRTGAEQSRVLFNKGIAQLSQSGVSLVLGLLLERTSYSLNILSFHPQWRN